LLLEKLPAQLLKQKNPQNGDFFFIKKITFMIYKISKAVKNVLNN